jgi:hypothetical protein
LRLEEISSVPSQAGEISFAQSFNSLYQITARHENDGIQWRYNYDDLGQLNFGKKYFNQGIAVAGQWFEYTYDDIGALTNKKRGGNLDGSGLNSADYVANSKNQYTSVEFPNSINILGHAWRRLQLRSVRMEGPSRQRNDNGLIFTIN